MKPLQRMGRAITAKPAVLVGLLLLLGCVAVALMVPLLSPYDANASVPQDRLQPPSAAHLLGTDDFGRDVLTRLAVGISMSVQVAIATSLVSLVLGVLLGLLAVFVRSLDQIIMRICDGLLAIPGVLLALAVVAATGANLYSLIACLIIVETPSVTRLARAAALAARDRRYVEAAEAAGVRAWAVVTRHVLPSVWVPVAVQASAVFGAAIIIEAALSFLGAGIPAPTASLGNMLNEAKGFVNTAWWLIVYPGIALAALVLGANLIGDGVANSGLLRAGVRTRLPKRAATAPAVAPQPQRDGASADADADDDVDVDAPHPAALRVQDLHVAYDGEVVVRGVSFSIAPGEVVALVGESGSGKSTTAAAVLGLLPGNAVMRAREIAVGGVPVQPLDEASMGAVRGTVLAYVPQDPGGSLDPVLRVGSQIAEVLVVHRLASRAEQPARVAELLREAGISDPERVAARYPHELSGGLQQRVLIAQALAGNPRVIVADEPTSALDVTVQKEVLDNLAQSTAERGVAVLLITHDLAVAAERADRVIVLRHGRIVEGGPARQVLAAPVHEYTRSLVAATPAAIAQSLREQPVAAVAAVTDPLLRVTDLVKTFRAEGRQRFRAVDGVSLQLAAGRTLALVGESGSGKTTTARMISRLERADSGTVHLAGREITGLRGTELRELRREIQYVHQNPRSSLNPRFTVAEAVGEPLQAFQMGTPATRRDRVAELLERVALPLSLLDRRTDQISGGQAQRVSIARALALDPAVLVLDEAVSALDVSVQARVLDVLEELRASLHLTYVFVSHDLAVVARIASDVAVMHSGRVVESGTALQVLEDPQQDYTKRLLAAVPGVSAAGAH